MLTRLTTRNWHVEGKLVLLECHVFLLQLGQQLPEVVILKRLSRVVGFEFGYTVLEL